MKKIISVILVAALVFCLCSCRLAKNTDSSALSSVNETVLESTDESLKETVTSEIESNVVSDNSAVESSKPESSASSKVSSSSNLTVSSQKQPTASNNTSKPAEKTKPNFGKYNLRVNYTLDDMLKEVPHYTFKLSAQIVNYVTYEDLIYVVMHNNFTNKSFIGSYDAKAGKNIYSNTLTSRPAEIHLYDNELWISFPELCQINIYNKTNFELLRSINTGVNVYSFDKYNDYVFFVGENKEQLIYRYDIKNNVIKSMLTLYGEDKSISGMFYEPSILVDKKTYSLFIAESNRSHCKLYAYNIESMEEIGVFDSSYTSITGNYGVLNDHRNTIFTDGYIYWSCYKINPKIFWKEECKYSGPGIIYADKDYVATYLGVYDNNSGKKIVSFNPNIANVDEVYKVAITKCKNIMIADDINIYIFYG